MEIDVVTITGPKVVDTGLQEVASSHHVFESE